MIPDSLPVISAGKHSSASEGACVMEYVSMLAGEPFSDTPSCTHPALARAAQTANDRLPDGERHLMVSRINRLFGTNSAVGAESRRVSVGLAQFAAAHAARSANAADNAAAADDASYAAAYAAYAYAYASRAAAGAADAAADAYAAANAAYAAAYAADACSAANAHAAEAKLAFLDELLDEYDRLTGRTAVEDVEARLPALACKVGAGG